MMRAFVFGRRPWLRGLVVAVSAVAIGGTWLGVGGTLPAGATSVTLATFNTPGCHAWSVPSSVTKITFTVYGASGGNAANPGGTVALGGAGGEAKGTFKVKPGQTFEVCVGGRGKDNSGIYGGDPGANGGSFGGNASSGIGGGGGGGGSDVRIGSKGDACAPNCDVIDRIIVAGGGGGGGQNYDGGAGGGLSGGPSGTGWSAGQDGDLMTSFSQGFGDFLEGGYGQPSSSGGGGGGGGWFGGRGGGTAGTTAGGGGGGGSGFISSLALSGSFPTSTHGGDGLVKITTS